MIFPTFSQNLFTLCSNPQNRWFQQAFFKKSNTWTPHTNISACIQFVQTHTSTSMSSCTLQPFPPCVRFTRHFCCLPWVFRVMLCVESSQPNSPAWSQMAWCGWLWLCLLSSPDRHMMNHIPAPSKTAHRGRYTGSLTNTTHSSARREKQLSSTSFCMEINFNKPSQSSQQQQATERRKKKKSKSTKEQRGGGGRKLSHSPLLSGSLFFPLCDLCPWPGPIHVPQIAQLMPQ